MLPLLHIPVKRSGIRYKKPFLGAFKVVTKMTVFWDVTTYSLVYRYKRVERTIYPKGGTRFMSTKLDDITSQKAVISRDVSHS